MAGWRSSALIRLAAGASSKQPALAHIATCWSNQADSPPRPTPPCRAPAAPPAPRSCRWPCTCSKAIGRHPSASANLARWCSLWCTVEHAVRQHCCDFVSLDHSRACTDTALALVTRLAAVLAAWTSGGSLALPCELASTGAVGMRYGSDVVAPPAVRGLAETLSQTRHCTNNVPNVNFHSCAQYC